MAEGKVIVVQGGQWGSEAKGLVCDKLTKALKPKVAIRTGTVNAGHTVYHEGRPYAMQQLPVSWTEPSTELVLGPGAYISPEILLRELCWIQEATGVSMEAVLARLYVDRNCGIHINTQFEKQQAQNDHYRIGATGKGCSYAVIRKINGRGADGNPTTFAQWLHDEPGCKQEPWRSIASRLIDTVDFTNSAYDHGHTLLVEGTQGTLLDLHLGDYPYTTHKQTQPSNWLAESGLASTVNHEVWGVYRTYPIRVAGNSGPLPSEISWPELAYRVNQFYPAVPELALSEWAEAVEVTLAESFPGAPKKDPAYWTLTQREHYRRACSEVHALAFTSLPEGMRQQLAQFFEFTTVTKKLRRVARWDWEVFARSTQLIRPTRIALTFMNYLFPQYWGATDSFIGPECWDFIRRVEMEADCPVAVLSFGPDVTNTFLREA